MTLKAPEATRSKLLDAARDLILDQGVTELTLDAVSARSGISKGGLLHHFHNKDALLSGVLERYTQMFNTHLEEKHALEPNLPGRWLRAYVHCTFKPLPNEALYGQATFKLSTSHIHLIQALQQYFENLESRLVSDGLPAARVTAVRLACDGFWVADLQQFPSTKEPSRTALYSELIALSTPG